MADKGTITVEYPIERLPGGLVKVETFTTARTESAWRNWARYYRSDGLFTAVVKWLDENPPKPAWHDAKPGEGWVITLTNGRTFRAFAQVFDAGVRHFQTAGGGIYYADSSSITAARLEWPLPEGDDNA